MQEIGVVSSIEGINAIVSVERKGACEHCTAGTCNTSGEKVSLEAINEAGAVVGHKNDERVIGHAEFLEQAENAANVGVEVVDHRRVDRHLLRLDLPFLVRQVVPDRHFLDPWW